MRVIARIPDASASADPSRAEMLSSPIPRGRADDHARTRRAGRTWPVATLAVVAIVAWVLASWSERVRLHRQRGELRVAHEPAASSGASGPGSAAGGALVR